MDRFTRVVIGFTIAILYPLLVFMIVSQVFPIKDSSSPNPPEIPSYAKCGDRYSRYGYDFSSSDPLLRNEGNYDKCVEKIDNEYGQKNKEYDEALNNHHDAKRKSESIRMIGMMTIAVITLVISYRIRSIEELSGGLVVGSSLVIVVTSLGLAITNWDSSMKLPINILLLVSFGILTTLIWFVDRKLPKKDIDKPTNGNQLREGEYAPSAPNNNTQGNIRNTQPTMTRLANNFEEHDDDHGNDDSDSTL